LIKTGLVLSFDEADDFLAKQLEPVPVDYIGIHPWGGNLATQGLERTLQHIRTPAYKEFTDITHKSGKQIDHKGCDKNRHETCGLPELLGCFGSKDSRVLEYWLDNSRFSQWAKPWRKLQFDPEIMSRDVAYYHSLKFESMTTFACWLGKEYQQEYNPPDFMAYANIINNRIKV
jgi:hypothetical protein